MISFLRYPEQADEIVLMLERQTGFSAELEAAVSEIVSTVRDQGDAAVRDYTRKFDGVSTQEIAVDPRRIASAQHHLDPELRGVVQRAAHNIRRFHERQKHTSWFVDDGDGVTLGQRVVPVESVGLYVPGGKAFYPSTVLMNAIPAQVAGVSRIQIVSPPGPDGFPNVQVLAVAGLMGVESVFSVGGAQAIAALAYGTETIPRVDKIVGPGNAFVACAKKQVFGRVGIDSIAGPSEIVVLADATADAEFVAADLLSQAEHDEEASAVLITTSSNLAEQVQWHVMHMYREHERSDILQASLKNHSSIILVGSLEEGVRLVNRIAPEHLEIMTQDPRSIMEGVRHAGAIFLGNYSAEPVGDYYAGPNHVLPTAGTARFSSALSVDDFVRKQSVISYSAERLARTGGDIIKFAQKERLPAHAHAIQVRLNRMRQRGTDQN